MKIAGKILLIGVFFISIGLLFANFYFRPEIGDEGIIAMDGWRIYKGEIPHRDFFQFIPPLAGYVQSAVFKFFSPSIFAVRFLGFVYGTLLLLLTFLFYRKYIKSDMVTALALSFIVPFGVGSWLFGSHHWLVAILQICGGIVFSHSLEHKSRFWAVISGIFFGNAIFTMQDQGGYLVIGLIICTFFVSKKERRYFCIAVSSSIITFFILALPLVFSASLKEVLWQWVYFPFLHYKGALGNQFSIINFLKQISSAWSVEAIKVSPLYALSSSISSTFQCLTPLLSIGSLLFLWIKGYMDRTNLSFISVISVSALLGAFHRLAMTNLAWAFLSLLPFYILVDKMLVKKRKKIKILAYSFVMFFLLSNLIFSFSRSIHCIKVDDTIVVNSSAGKYRFFDPYKARILSEFVKAIEKEVPSGEPMFCVGYIPLINFMTRHPNPTKFNFILPGGYNSKEQIATFLSTIESKKVKWGIVDKSVVKSERISNLLPGFKIFFENDDYILIRKD